MKPTIQRVLSYARVSSEPQTRSESLALQQKAAETYAKSRGLKASPRVYIEAESAVYEKLECREQMQALMRDARAGDLVLVDKLNRWSRDPEFTYRSMRELKEKGVAVYFIAEGIDPATAEGDRQLDMRIVFAKWEHQRIRERMVGARLKLREQGYYVEGTVPPGYKRKRSAASAQAEKATAAERREVYELVIVERDARVVRAIFAACIAGRSLPKIAEAFGVSQNFVRSVLGRRMYTGVLNYGGRWVSGQVLEGGESIKGKHPAVVDSATFARAQQALQARRTGGPRPRGDRGVTATWVLRDVARCGRCGSRMTSASASRRTGNRVHYYACIGRLRYNKCTAPYVRVDEIEEFAAPYVPMRLEQLETLLGKPPKEEAPVKSVDEKIATLTKKRERYMEMFADGTMPKASMLSKVTAVDGELQKLEAEQPTKSPLADPKKRKVLLDSIESITRAWKKATPKRRRAIANILATSCQIERVHHHGEDDLDLEFVWKPVEELALGDLAAQLRG